MSTLPLIITNAGLAAAVAADGQGLQLSIAKIALGSGAWSPDVSATELHTPIIGSDSNPKELTAFGASVLAPDRIHVTIRDDSADVYELREIGLIDENGDLFAIHAQSEPIVSKAASGKVLITATIPLTTTPPNSVTIVGNEFDYPPFSETILGVGREATNSEVESGASHLILSPEKAAPWFYNPNNPPPSDVPPGTILSYAGDVTPAGYLRSNFAEVGRITYSDLFGAIGTRYGPGDGVTTFNLPEVRGEFGRFWDDGRGVDLGRILGSWKPDELKSHYHAVRSRNQYSLNGGSHAGAPSVGSLVGSTTESFGGVETRPRSIAFMGIIKY